MHTRVLLAAAAALFGPAGAAPAKGGEHPSTMPEQVYDCLRLHKDLGSLNGFDVDKWRTCEEALNLVFSRLAISKTTDNKPLLDYRKSFEVGRPADRQYKDIYTSPENAHPLRDMLVNMHAIAVGHSVPRLVAAPEGVISPIGRDVARQGDLCRASYWDYRLVSEATDIDADDLAEHEHRIREAADVAIFNCQKCISGARTNMSIKRVEGYDGISPIDWSDAQIIPAQHGIGVSLEGLDLWSHATRLTCAALWRDAWQEELKRYKVKDGNYSDVPEGMGERSPGEVNIAHAFDKMSKDIFLEFSRLFTKGTRMPGMDTLTVNMLEQLKVFTPRMHPELVQWAVSGRGLIPAERVSNKVLAVDSIFAKDDSKDSGMHNAMRGAMSESKAVFLNGEASSLEGLIFRHSVMTNGLRAARISCEQGDQRTIPPAVSSCVLFLRDTSGIYPPEPDSWALRRWPADIFFLRRIGQVEASMSPLMWRDTFAPVVMAQTFGLSKKLVPFNRLCTFMNTGWDAWAKLLNGVPPPGP